MKQTLSFIRESYDRFSIGYQKQLIILAAVVFVCYGFMGCYLSYNNDIPLFLDVRWNMGFQQGRWGYGILAFLGFANLHLPFWSAFIGMCFLYVAVLLWGLFFYQCSEYKISKESIWVLMLLFASFSLNYEIFVFPFTLVTISSAFISLIFSFFICQKRKMLLSDYLCASFWAAWAFSIYEVYVFVYLLLVLFVCMIQYYYNKHYEKDFLYCKLKRFALVLGGAVGIFIIGSILSHWIFGYQYGPARDIDWLSISSGYFEHLLFVIRRLLYDYFRNGMYYFSIFMFVISMICWFLLCAKFPVKMIIRIGLFILGLGIVFALSFILGRSMPYRMAQTVVVFTVVCWMLFWNSFFRLKSWRWFMLFFIIFFQSKEINTWAFYDYRSSEKNIANIRKIGFDIQSEFGRYPNKKIVFCHGCCWLREMPFIQTFPMQFFSNVNRRTYINQHAGYILFYEQSTQFLSLFEKVTGLEVELQKDYQYYHSKIKEYVVPEWPRKGYIKELEDCILVNLGKPPKDTNGVSIKSEK